MKWSHAVALALMIAGLILAIAGGRRLIAAVDTPATAPATSATLPAKPDVRVVRLSVSSPAFQSFASRVGGDTLHLSTSDFNTSVTLQIRDPGEIMLDASLVLTAAQDDTGKTLLASAKVQQSSMIVWEPSVVSKDHHDALLDVEFTDRPAENARELILRGTAKIRVARSKQVTHGKIALVPSTSFGPEQLRLRITNVIDYGESLSIVVQTPGSIEQLGGISFSDDGGRLLATRPTNVDGLGSRSFGQTPKLTYGLPGTPEDVNVDVAWYDRVEDVQVPFEVRIGASFQEVTR